MRKTRNCSFTNKNKKKEKRKNIQLNRKEICQLDFYMIL